MIRMTAKVVSTHLGNYVKKITLNLREFSTLVLNKSNNLPNQNPEKSFSDYDTEELQNKSYNLS